MQAATMATIATPDTMANPGAARVSGANISTENGLLNLSSPVLEIIMQLKAGIIKPSNDLRATFAKLLKELEQQGDSLGFKDRHIQAIKFALASFVDETVLTADFPLRDQWEKYPLQLEYFKEHLAGVTYFERLNELLKDLEANADVIEVYYLCLLLGFKGKYKLYLEDQLVGVIEVVADHLRRIGRLRAGALSPHWQVNDQPIIDEQPGLPLWLKIGSFSFLTITILIYMAMKFSLAGSINTVREALLR